MQDRDQDERIEDEGVGEVEEAFKKTGIEDSLKEGGVRKRKGIRARVARRWLHRLGYNWREVKKGIYIDGHERADVVESVVRDRTLAFADLKLAGSFQILFVGCFAEYE